jgi:osmotically-inducible protein OsmY
MKKLLTPVVIASVVLLGAVGCGEGTRTTSDAPSDPNKVGEVPTVEQVQETREDNTSDVRAAQRQSDERARADRAQVGNGAPTSDGDIESLVRNSLERQMPGAPLAVQSEEGVVTISGTVPNQQQLAQIQPAAQQVPGVRSVKLNVKIAPPVPANPN